MLRLWSIPTRLWCVCRTPPSNNPAISPAMVACWMTSPCIVRRPLVYGCGRCEGVVRGPFLDLPGSLGVWRHDSHADPAFSRLLQLTCSYFDRLSLLCYEARWSSVRHSQPAAEFSFGNSSGAIAALRSAWSTPCVMTLVPQLGRPVTLAMRSHQEWRCYQRRDERKTEL